MKSFVKSFGISDQCCWDNCRWETPPEECLKHAQDVYWFWNEKLQYFVARRGKVKGSGIRNYNICN